MACALAECSALAQTLMDAFWPGPLTLVMPKRSDCPLSHFVSGGLDSIAVRCPSHPIAQAVLQKSALPIAAPSANISGSISPTKPEHVTAGLGDKVTMVLDGGEAEIGLESTIIGLLEPDGLTLLRPGSLTKEAIEDVAKIKVSDAKTDKIIAPGQMKRHYAPEVPVRLSAFNADADEVMIGFGAVDGDFNLSLAGNVVEAAHRLFDILRQAETQVISEKKRGIAIAPIPFEGIGIAMHDRLARASVLKEK